MSRLEIQPLSELRDAAARLLAETYARRLAAEPLLPDAADFGAYAAPEPQAVDRRMVNLLSYASGRGGASARGTCASAGRSRSVPAMPTASTIALFALASLALAVVPGPAVTYIVTQSVDKGRRAGLASAGGVASGGLVHVAAATIGLSALIASSAAAFTAVKLVGAAYLVAVGIRRIVARDETATEPQPVPLQRVWAQGVVVNVLNPKTALFFLAFLPQFVDPHRGAAWTQVAFLGCLFSLIAFGSDVTYALLADLLAVRVRRGGRAAGLRRWLSGGIFVALGVAAAAAHRS